MRASATLGMVLAHNSYMGKCRSKTGPKMAWRNTDTTRFTLLPSDINPEAGVTVADFRTLPYAPESIDVVVLDPPYVHGGVLAGG